MIWIENKIKNQTKCQQLILKNNHSKVHLIVKNYNNNNKLKNQKEEKWKNLNHNKFYWIIINNN